MYLLSRGLFSYNRYYQLSCSTKIPVLAEVDALPCAEVQTAIGNGDGDADTTQRRLGMGGHIVSPLQRMLIVGLILWNQTIKDGLHIDANIWVAILIDAQSAASVLREDVHDARLRQLRQLAHNLYKLRPWDGHAAEVEIYAEAV